MERKKLTIVLASVLAFVVLASLVSIVCIIHFKDKEITAMHEAAQGYLTSIDTHSKNLDELTATLTTEQQTVADLTDEMSALNTQMEDVLNENDRLYKLIEDSDTNQNIEDYFEKVAYLTFDDGPSYLTKRTLDILDEYNIKATFFVIHTDYGERHDLYKEIVDRGHAIGNHTYSHAYVYNGWDKFWEDFYKMEDFIFEQTGVRTKLVRFPGGSSNYWNEDEECHENIEKMLSMGYQYFDWNVTVGDGAEQPSIMEVYNAVVLRTRRGRVNKAVILMHDRNGNNNSIKALPDIIKFLAESGYTFLPLNEDSFAPHIYGEEVFDVEILD